jgi:hypothetical protein
MTTDILWFSELGLKDLDRVGGKNASLGEMVQNLTSAGVPTASPRPRMPTATSWQIPAWTRRLPTGWSAWTLTM